MTLALTGGGAIKGAVSEVLDCTLVLELVVVLWEVSLLAVLALVSSDEKDKLSAKGWYDGPKWVGTVGGASGRGSLLGVLAWVASEE